MLFLDLFLVLFWRLGLFSSITDILAEITTKKIHCNASLLLFHTLFLDKYLESRDLCHIKHSDAARSRVLYMTLIHPSRYLSITYNICEFSLLNFNKFKPCSTATALQRKQLGCFIPQLPRHFFFQKQLMFQE